MKAQKEKKITLATFKRFVRMNSYSEDALFVLVQSAFDGMTDCVQAVKDIPAKVDHTKIDLSKPNTLGIAGVWLVGDSRDYFYKYEDALLEGFRVSNSCGSFIVAKMKERV